MYKYLFLLVVLFFTACSKNSIVLEKKEFKTQEKKLQKEKVIDSKNMYMQRVEFQAKQRARKALEKEVKIDSLNKVKKMKNSLHIKQKSIQSSNVNLENTFIKEDINVKDLKVLNKQELLNSMCYSKSILNKIDTKAKLYKYYPLWFFDSNLDGKIGGVGIAKYIKNRSYSSQKKLALILAKNDLSKSLKSNVKVKNILSKELKNKNIKKEFKTFSTQKSSNLIKRVVLEDIYINPKTCDLFVWVIRK